MNRISGDLLNRQREEAILYLKNKSIVHSSNTMKEDSRNIEDVTQLNILTEYIKDPANKNMVDSFNQPRNVFEEVKVNELYSKIVLSPPMNHKVVNIKSSCLGITNINDIQYKWVETDNILHLPDSSPIKEHIFKEIIQDVYQSIVNQDTAIDIMEQESSKWLIIWKHYFNNSISYECFIDYPKSDSCSWTLHDENLHDAFDLKTILRMGYKIILNLKMVIKKMIKESIEFNYLALQQCYKLINMKDVIDIMHKRCLLIKRYNVHSYDFYDWNEHLLVLIMKIEVEIRKQMENVVEEYKRSSGMSGVTKVIQSCIVKEPEGIEAIRGKTRCLVDESARPVSNNCSEYGIYHVEDNVSNSIDGDYIVSCGVDASIERKTKVVDDEGIQIVVKDSQYSITNDMSHDVIDIVVTYEIVTDVVSDQVSLLFKEPNKSIIHQYDSTIPNKNVMPIDSREVDTCIVKIVDCVTDTVVLTDTVEVNNMYEAMNESDQAVIIDTSLHYIDVDVVCAEETIKLTCVDINHAFIENDHIDHKIVLKETNSSIQVHMIIGPGHNAHIFKTQQQMLSKEAIINATEHISEDVGTSLSKTNKVLDRKALMVNLNEESIYLDKRIQSKFNKNKHLLRKDRMCQQIEISDTMESEFKMYSRSAYTELIKTIPEYVDDSDDNENHVNVSKTDAYGDQDTLDNAIIKAKIHVHGASVCIEECDTIYYVALKDNVRYVNNIFDHVGNMDICKEHNDDHIDHEVLLSHDRSMLHMRTEELYKPIDNISVCIETQVLADIRNETGSLCSSNHMMLECEQDILHVDNIMLVCVHDIHHVVDIDNCKEQSDDRGDNVVSLSYDNSLIPMCMKELSKSVDNMNRCIETQETQGSTDTFNQTCSLFTSNNVVVECEQDMHLDNSHIGIGEPNQKQCVTDMYVTNIESPNCGTETDCITHLHQIDIIGNTTPTEESIYNDKNHNTDTNAILYISDSNNGDGNNNITSDKLISNIMNGITNIYDVLISIDKLYVNICEVYACKVNDKKDFDVLIEYNFGSLHSIIIGNVTINLNCVYDDDILSIMRAHLVLAYGNKYKPGAYYNNKTNDDKRMHTVELYLNYIMKLHININNDITYYTYIHDKSVNTNMSNNILNCNSSNTNVGINTNTKVESDGCDNIEPIIYHILSVDNNNQENDFAKDNPLHDMATTNANESSIATNAINVAGGNISLYNDAPCNRSVSFKKSKKRQKQKLKRTVDSKLVANKVDILGMIHEDGYNNCNVAKTVKLRRLSLEPRASNHKCLRKHIETCSVKVHAPRSYREPDDKELHEYDIVDVFGSRDSYMIITRLISDINGTKVFEREHKFRGSTKYSRYTSSIVYRKNKKKTYEGCYRCGVHGHIRKHCRFKKSN